MTTNQDFECGHDNPVSSRFCAVCGAARLRSCRACEAPVQWDARYCGTCGARLYERDAASDQDVVEWARARRGQDEAARHALVDDPIDDDAEDGSRRRPAGTVATIAVILAAVVGLGYFALARHTVFLERMPDKRDVRVSVPITPPAPSTDTGQAAVNSTPPPPASTTPATSEDLVASKSPDKAASPSGAQLATSSEEQVARPGEEQVASPGEEKVAMPSEQPPARSARPREAQSQEVSLPARVSARENAPSQAEDNREQPRMAPSPARTSEERMAAFLVDELGRERAAEKARSNADWYDEGRSERAYWRRVADAVNRRGSR
jgi:Double zinc ribbon